MAAVMPLPDRRPPLRLAFFLPVNSDDRKLMRQLLHHDAEAGQQTANARPSRYDSATNSSSQSPISPVSWFVG